MGTQSEQKEFTYDLSHKKAWCKLGGRYTEAGVRYEFWNDYQNEILPELQDELDNGWTPITEIGPAGIKITTKKERFFDWDVEDWLMYFGYGIVTFGILFFFPGSVWIARPSEFRVTLRRKKAILK